MRLLTLAITIPVVLLLSRCTQDGEREAEMGRKWCEAVIAIFESDRPAFLTKHSRQIHHGLLVVRPTNGLRPGAASFAVQPSGEFACRYWHDGVLFAQGHEFNSNRRRWTQID